MISRAERARTGRFVAAAVVVGLGIALVGALRIPASLDEAFVYALTQHGVTGVFDAWRHDPQALLPQLVSWPFGATSSSLVWLRLPSLAAFAGAIIGTWWTARPLVGARMAALAALFTAVSVQAVNAATDARWPAMAMLTVVWGWGFLVRAADGDRGPHWPMYALMLAAGIYCNALVVLMVPAHAVALWALSHRRSLLPWAVSVVAAGIAAVPLVLAVRASNAPNPLVRLHVPAPQEVPGFGAALVGAGSPSHVRQLLFVAVALVIAAGLACVWRGAAHPTDVVPARVLAAWVLLPLALAFAVSQMGSSVWEPRYVVGVIPGLAIWLAWAIGQFPSRAVAVVVAAALVIAMAGVSLNVARGAGNEQTDLWTSALAGMHDPGTPVVFYEAEGVQAAGYYQPEFRNADGDVVVPGWPAAAPSGDLVLLDNPTFDRLPPGPPSVQLVQSLLRRDGRVVLALRPPSQPTPAVTWARTRCDVTERHFRSQSLYRISGCR